MIDPRAAISHSGKAWIVLAGLAVLLYVVWTLSNSIATGNFQAALLLASAFAAFFVAGRIAGDWRSGVYFFFVWLLVEDLIRKYMGNSMYIYFLKDVLVGMTYISILADQTHRPSASFRPPFRYALGAFLLLGLVQVFNPLSPSIFYGLLGLKLYFYYIPLMFVGYAMLRTEDDLRRFLIVNMAMSGVIALVGILQSVIGQGFLNPHSGADIEELGHLVRYTPSGIAVIRPDSVFVSDGRFANYLILAFTLGLGAAGFLLLRPGRGRSIVFSAIGLIALATGLSGSRSAFLFAAATGLVIPAAVIWGAPPQKGDSYRLVKAIRRSFVAVCLTLTFAVILFPDAIGNHWAYYRETVNPESENFEAGGRLWDYPIGNLVLAFDDPNWVVGHGIGTASLGGQYVSRIMEAPLSGVGVENGYGNMILEFGILGPILWLMWTASLMFAALKTALRLRGTWAFPVAVSIVWFAFILLFPFTWVGIVAYQNFVLNAYLWLFVGILFRLPDIVKQTSGGQKANSALTK